MPTLAPNKLESAWDLPFEGAWPTAVALLGDSGLLAAGNRDGQLLLWQLPQQPNTSDAAPLPVPVRRLDGHTNGITRLVSTRDGKTLVSASLDHTVRIWDPTTAAEGKAEVILDSAAREREAKRTRSDEPLKQPGVEVEIASAAHVFTEHGNWVQSLGISRDERRLITGDDACLTIVWDLAAHKEYSRWTGHPGNWVTAATLSSDGKIAFTAEYCAPRGSFDRPPAQARFWNTEDATELIDVMAVQLPDVKQRDNSYSYGSRWAKFVGRGFIAADFHPDGKLVAVGQGGETGTGQVHLIETATGKLLRTVAGHRYGVTDVMFSDDGQFVLSTGRDTTLQICNVADGKEVAKLGTSRGGQFKDWLSAVAVSPDQRWVAAADIAGIVHVWHAAT